MNTNCAAVKQAAQIARSKSLPAVRSEAANGLYIVQMVAAFRAWQLRHDGANARRLLRLLPKNEEERSTLLKMGDLCEAESEHEMITSANVRVRLPKAFSEAVLVASEFLPQYLRYAIEAAGDPHNDIAIQMVKVCRTHHPELTRALGELSLAERDQLRSYVFAAGTCKPLAIPESEK